jgi:anti-sigma regulatory factor (Ser/Thr protein kinase)
VSAHLEPTDCPFEHEVFIYESDETYADVLVPLLAGAVAAGDAVVAVVPHRNTAVLRSHLDGIQFIDAGEWYEQPAETIARYDAVLRALEPGTRAFVVGEVEFGPDERDWAGWTRYESALNRALEHHCARVVCPYDARALPASVVEDSRRTHPLVLTPSSRREPSPHYVDPDELIPRLARTVHVPRSPAAVDMRVDVNVRPARHLFAAAAAAAGLSRERVEELTVAVNEILTNAVVHGGGTARLRIWTSPVDGLTCAIEDDGPGARDPLLGFVPPPQGATGGYGVWMARRIFDRSELIPSPGGGLTVLLAADG